MNSKTTKLFIICLSVAILSIVGAIGFGVALAWTEPTQAPPSGNVAASVNVGNASQTKTGPLTVGGDLISNTKVQAPQVCVGENCRSVWPTGGDGTGPWATAAGNKIYYNSGNVGIGTDNPTHALEAVSTSNAFRVGNANSWFKVWTGGNSRLSLGDGAGNEAGFITGEGNSGQNSIKISACTDNGSCPGYIAFLENGRVGIDTTVPSSKLEVNGNLKVTGPIVSTTDIYVGSVAEGNQVCRKGGINCPTPAGVGEAVTTSGNNASVSGNLGVNGYFSVGNNAPTARLDVDLGTGLNVGGAAVIGHSDNLASGSYSIATGYKTTASGFSSAAMGGETVASGSYSTATGLRTTASGSYSTATGEDTVASGEHATAMGRNTVASGRNATAMGQATTASGSNSTAMGYNTTASSLYATAMGSGTTASHYGATAMGLSATASGRASTAMGENAIASGHYGATAMGHNTTASGTSSTAMGNSTAASGHSSTAMGVGTKAESAVSTAIGRYNVGGGTFDSWVATDPLFEIGNGNGTSNTDRSNALTVYKNGKVNVKDLEGSGDAFVCVNANGKLFRKLSPCR